MSLIQANADDPLWPDHSEQCEDHGLRVHLIQIYDRSMSNSPSYLEPQIIVIHIHLQ